MPDRYIAVARGTVADVIDTRPPSTEEPVETPQLGRRIAVCQTHDTGRTIVEALNLAHEHDANDPSSTISDLEYALLAVTDGRVFDADLTVAAIIADVRARRSA